MHKILFVSEKQGYILSSLKQRLTEMEYAVAVSPADPDELNRDLKDISVVLLFADDDISAKQQGITFLKDTAVGNDIPVFVVGDSDEMEKLEGLLPKHLVQKNFTRPININEVAAAIDKYMRTEGKHNKRKILVVDDSGAMLRNVKGWLEDKYQVILANSGAMAIKYLSTNRPDLVLLDYEMPIVDGSQVLAMIRSEVDFNGIPVIFLTSKRDKESIMKVMELKPDGYLLKTMPPEQIVKAVDDFFMKRRAEGK